MVRSPLRRFFFRLREPIVHTAPSGLFRRSVPATHIQFLVRNCSGGTEQTPLFPPFPELLPWRQSRGGALICTTPSSLHHQSPRSPGIGILLLSPLPSLPRVLVSKNPNARHQAVGRQHCHMINDPRQVRKFLLPCFHPVKYQMYCNQTIGESVGPCLILF